MKPAALLFLLAAAAQAAEPVEFTVGEFVFDRPEGWKWVASNSPMRKAQLSVPGPEGAVADVVFFHFGAGQGGTVDANIQRWLGQFENRTHSNTREKKSGERRATLVEASGTFLSGMPGEPAIPMENFALRGAILSSAEGDVYVKMTGPAAVVDNASTAFLAMIDGALAKN